jgi:hypothetical protein
VDLNAQQQLVEGVPVDLNNMVQPVVYKPMTMIYRLKDSDHAGRAHPTTIALSDADDNQYCQSALCHTVTLH